MGMKLGLVARADNRGLGLQCREFFLNMAPDRVLVIDAKHQSPYPQNLDWYPDGIVTPWHSDGTFDEPIMRKFLQGLDVVYIAETPGDYLLYDIAREYRVKTVCHVNPEFYRYVVSPKLPRPDVIWLPTSWLANKVPHDRILHFPVNRAHLPFRLRTEANTFLHVVGHRAARDRNGTHQIFKAFRFVRSPTTLLIRSQQPSPSLTTARHVKVRHIIENVQDHAELYSEGDVLLLPRRYGGNCLIMNEALSCGLPVLMTDCSPQNTLLPPEMLIRSRTGVGLKAQSGRIPTVDIDPNYLAGMVDRLIADPAEVERLSKTADAIAATISWEALKPVYIQALEEVAAR